MHQLRLLAHVAFHYSPQREKYLAEVVRNFIAYREHLQHVSVVIDTNTEETRARLQPLLQGLPFSVEVRCHEDLPHPFALTRAHRQHMQEQVNAGAFDVFMYLEDDIVIPWRSFAAWLADNACVYRAGYLRGFLRVEKAEDGRVVAVDFKTVTSDPVFFRIGTRYYFVPEYPYHACWVYDRVQMRDFMASGVWKDRDDAPHMMRERAAFGMATWGSRFHGKTVVPVEPDGTIPEEAFNYHVPNNYCADPDSPFAKIPIDELFTGRITLRSSWYRYYLAFRSFAAKVARRLKRVFRRER